MAKQIAGASTNRKASIRRLMAMKRLTDMIRLIGLPSSLGATAKSAPEVFLSGRDADATAPLMNPHLTAMIPQAAGGPIGAASGKYNYWAGFVAACSTIAQG